MYFYCEKCKKQYPLNTHAIRCSCGGLFRLHKDPEDVVPQDVSIGHMVTPLVPMNAGGIEVLLKLENLQPTGSYKDRGAATLVSVAKSLGITKIALDSAGYAGASVAAYAAAAGMDCRVYVPEGVPDGARQQLQTYGAEVEVVTGTRMDACAEVKKHLGTSWYYASPAYNPLFAEGVKSLAHELYEQLGGKVPEYVFVPAGNGSLVIGLYLGFMEIGRLPRIVAVQTDGCAPLYRAFMEKRGIPVEEDDVGKVFDDPNFSIERPKRLQEMLFAIESSGGDVPPRRLRRAHRRRRPRSRKEILPPRQARQLQSRRTSDGQRLQTVKICIRTRGSRAGAISNDIQGTPPALRALPPLEGGSKIGEVLA